MMKLSRILVTALLAGTLIVLGCGDDGGSGSGNGNGSGDACDQLLPRCDNCTGDLAQETCRDLVNDIEVDECAFLLEADPGGCPFEL